MTRKILETAGSDTDVFARAQSLAAAIKHHCSSETASFHTPGHKARPGECSLLPLELSLSTADLTELPGLDDFTFPGGPIRNISLKLAEIWQSTTSFISVNGASAAIVAAIMSQAAPGKAVLIPENCHRSVVNALILSGMDAIWYHAKWHTDWGVWSGADQESFTTLLQQHGRRIACALAISVEYSGALNPLSAMVSACRAEGIPLIVDEAHGAHRLANSAVSQGAELVIHSLHKTLGALTQTGVLHTSSHSRHEIEKIRSNLNLVHSSSPSYLLLSSIEQAIGDRSSLHCHIAAACELAADLRQWLLVEAGAMVFNTSEGVDELHILFAFSGIAAHELNAALEEQGIFTETILGKGVLLLLGVGTTADDITRAKEAIEKARISLRPDLKKFEPGHAPRQAEQILNPREAWLSTSETISIHEASGRIASECVAPCPPGTPVICPGQRVPDDISTLLPGHRWLRVVVES